MTGTPHRRRLAAGALLAGLFAALAGAGVAHADRGTPGDDTSRATHSTGQPTRAQRPPARAVVPARRPPPAATTADTYRVANPIPMRRQWNSNGGYCGEASFVSAGLSYGQYLSQYDARALASNQVRQNRPASWLLLGVNDVAAAKAMHLTATPFNTAQQRSTDQFLTWVKTNATAGYPVIIGVFMNHNQFYGARNPNAGDTEYDHIVTVTGFTSSHPLTAPESYPDDVISFSDNGLWAPNGLPQYVFSYALSAFPANRRQANAARGAVYSLPSGANYGIAITGVADLEHETVPVRLSTSTTGELPAIVNGSNKRPAAKPVTLTITVSGLTPGQTYNLYRYSSMAAIPDSAFNANAANAAQNWQIVATAPTYTMTQTIMSNEVAAYRAVAATAH